MEFAMKWMFGNGPGIWSLLTFSFMLSVYLFKRFNHQTLREKLLNTGKSAGFALMMAVIFTGGEIANHDKGREYLPIIGIGVCLAVWLLADWTSFLLYSMANHAGGYKGWLADTWKRIKAIRLIKAPNVKPPIKMIAMLMLLLSAVACVTVLITPTVNPKTDPPYDLQGTIAELEKTYDAVTFTATPTATETATPTPTSTPTATPTSSIQELPTLGTGTYIYELPTADQDILARLCVVEVRGFGNERANACASVVSTVLERMDRHYLSDGTVSGTVGWNCFPGTLECQFSAFVVHGCAGIVVQACPYSYPEDIRYFQGVVRDYLRGRIHGQTCLGYIYYGSAPFDLVECIIRSENGQREGFHNS